VQTNSTPGVCRKKVNKNILFKKSYEFHGKLVFFKFGKSKMSTMNTMRFLFKEKKRKKSYHTKKKSQKSHKLQNHALHKQFLSFYKKRYILQQKLLKLGKFLPILSKNF
jgi:hypothetical protein